MNSLTLWTGENGLGRRFGRCNRAGVAEFQVVQDSLYVLFANENLKNNMSPGITHTAQRNEPDNLEEKPHKEQTPET